MCDPSFDLVFRFGKFVPGVTCMFTFFFFFFFFFTNFSWCKVCLLSVKQGNFIYMPVLSTICVAAQKSIPANTKHCNDVFGMSKTFYGRSQDALATLCVGRDVNIFHMIAICII